MQDWLAVREVSNADNMLLIIEGDIRNRTYEELYPPNALAVEVMIDSVRRLMEALVEVDAGQRFENVVDALQCKRVVVVLEAPSGMDNYGKKLILNE